MLSHANRPIAVGELRQFVAAACRMPSSQACAVADLRLACRVLCPLGMKRRFKPGDAVMLPDGARGVVSRLRQFVGTGWHGELEVMTGPRGTIGCGPWIYHQDQLELAEAAA